MHCQESPLFLGDPRLCIEATGEGEDTGEAFSPSITMDFSELPGCIGGGSGRSDSMDDFEEHVDGERSPSLTISATASCAYCPCSDCDEEEEEEVDDAEDWHDDSDDEEDSNDLSLDVKLLYFLSPPSVC